MKKTKKPRTPRPKEVQLTSMQEVVLFDRLVETGVTLAQVRRAIRALAPGTHVLTREEWDRIPWTAHPRKRPPRFEGLLNEYPDGRMPEPPLEYLPGFRPLALAASARTEPLRFRTDAPARRLPKCRRKGKRNAPA